MWSWLNCAKIPLEMKQINILPYHVHFNVLPLSREQQQISSVMSLLCKEKANSDCERIQLKGNLWHVVRFYKDQGRKSPQSDSTKLPTWSPPLQQDYYSSVPLSLCCLSLCLHVSLLLPQILWLLSSFSFHSLITLSPFPPFHLPPFLLLPPSLWHSFQHVFCHLLRADTK